MADNQGRVFVSGTHFVCIKGAFQILEVDIPVSEMTTGKTAHSNKYQICTFGKPIIPCWSLRAAGWYYSWLEDALQMKLRKGA